MMASKACTRFHILTVYVLRGSRRSQMCFPRNGLVMRIFNVLLAVFFKQAAEQIVNMAVIWEGIVLVLCHCNGHHNIHNWHRTDYPHYHDVIMGPIASQITSLTIVYSTVYSDADQRKYQCSASLAFVWGFNRRPVNSSHKWPVTRKMFSFDDVIMLWSSYHTLF